MTNQTTSLILTQAITTTTEALQTTSTKLAYSLWMRRFEEWYIEAGCPPITYDIIISYMATLEDEYNPANKMQALAAIKKLCDTIHKKDRDLIDLYTYMVIKSIKAAKHTPGPQGKLIPKEAVTQLLQTCKTDTPPGGTRDASIIAMLHSTGMRRAECSGLTMEDYKPFNHSVELKGTKNKKDRIAFLTEGALKYLQDWIACRGDTPGPIYWRTKRSGDLWNGKGISGGAIYNIIARRCRDAGIEFYTPHDFRRTLVSDLLSQDVDISLVSRIVGHSSVAMTARYDVRHNESMRKAISKIHTPY